MAVLLSVMELSAEYLKWHHLLSLTELGGRQTCLATEIAAEGGLVLKTQQFGDGLVLDRPTSGEYILDGIDVGKADDRKLSEIRNQKIGFVFQTYNLIPKTNALKNVELPMLYGGVERKKRITRAKELLELVEMSDREKHLPEELSGGQKQRVAIARAMANDPAIILADEPTGALDSKTGRLVMDLFHKLNKEKKKTIILITHSNELASETDRIISIRDGNIVGVSKGGVN